MSRWPKPPEGSWTEHYSQLGTAPMSYDDSTSPEFYELEREAIFKRAWLNVGRIEQVPRTGSYFTKEINAAKTSIIVVRGSDGEVRAFHNICRHRGNKLVWNDFPNEETSGTCRQFTCKYHGWRYGLDGALAFVQQEEEFFDLDKDAYGLVSVHCEVWAGFIFVNLAKQPEQSLTDFLGPMVTALDGYPFGNLTERFSYRAEIKANWKLYMDAFQEFYHAPILHGRQSPAKFSAAAAQAGFEAPHYQLDGPHRLVSTSGVVTGSSIRRCANRWKTSRAVGCSVRGTFRTWVSPRCRRDSTPPSATRGASTPSSCGPTSPSWCGRVLVRHLPILADVPQHPHLRRQRILRSRPDSEGAGRPRDGRGDLQGICAPGQQHPGGDTVDARIRGRLRVPSQRPGNPAAPPAPCGSAVGG